MTDEIKGFALRLKAKMEQRGMTQAYICKQSGLTSSMLSHYCTGQRLPSIPAALKIARILDTTIDYLAFGYDQPTIEYNHNDDASFFAEKSIPYAATPPSNGSAEDEAALLLKYHRLRSEGKRKVVIYIEDLLSSGKYS